jgi:hypothetical protein
MIFYFILFTLILLNKYPINKIDITLQDSVYTISSSELLLLLNYPSVIFILFLFSIYVLFDFCVQLKKSAIGAALFKRDLQKLVNKFKRKKLKIINR